MLPTVQSMLWSKIPTDDQKKNMAAWDYQPVGTRLFIDETGNITDNVTKELDDSRIIDIEEKTILSVSKFRAAHSLSCPGKDGDGLYCLALAPEICESHAT